MIKNGWEIRIDPETVILTDDELRHQKERCPLRIRKELEYEERLSKLNISEEEKEQRKRIHLLLDEAEDHVKMKKAELRME